MWEFFNQSVYPNLFDAHPPFQIDGNFGFVSGLAEALVQSHFMANASDEGAGGGAREIWVLPALPPSWREGSVRGLVARGGFVVDIVWSDGGRVERVGVESRLGGELVVRYDVAARGGGSVRLGNGSDDGLGDGAAEVREEEGGRFRIGTVKGGRYAFEFTWEEE